MVQLPNSERLQYWKLLAETILIVLVVPVLLFALLRDPSRAIDHAVGKAGR